MDLIIYVSFMSATGGKYLEVNLLLVLFSCHVLQILQDRNSEDSDGIFTRLTGFSVSNWYCQTEQKLLSKLKKVISKIISNYNFQNVLVLDLAYINVILL